MVVNTVLLELSLISHSGWLMLVLGFFGSIRLSYPGTKASLISGSEKPTTRHCRMLYSGS